MTTNTKKITKQKKTSKYILQPCPMPAGVCLQTLKKYVDDDIKANEEFFDNMQMSYRISSPTKAEWILNKAIAGGKMVGGGSNHIDIVSDKIGIDVSVLTLGKGEFTNEKSIMQNFSKSGNLDSMFNNEKGDKAVRVFQKQLKKKYETDDIEEFLYIIFICHQKNIYLTCLKLYPANIPNMKFVEFSKSGKTIIVGNFIKSTYGNTKLYKSKKRLELRLCKDIIDSEFSTKIY
jgi:hypothetical protein